VIHELVERDMTISDLARIINTQRSHVSETISGRWVSKTIEQRIADYLGKPREYLFPARTGGEIIAMRKAEQGITGDLQKRGAA
jgi:plasmid maintenance system antidote protein VapI